MMAGAYLAVLLPLLAWLEWGGGGWWLQMLVYLGPQVWAAPFLLALPVCLLARSRWAYVSLLGIGLTVFGFGHPRWSGSSAVRSGPAGLVVMTSNAGQRSLAVLGDWIREERPDVIVLQEISLGQVRRVLLPGLPGMHLASVGEFVLLSRHPVIRSGVLPGMLVGRQPAVAWFELQWQGAPLVVYNVHLRSPRYDFEKLVGVRKVSQAPASEASGFLPPAGRRAFAEALRQRLDVMGRLEDYFRHEPRRFLVAGDFNWPDRGEPYHRLASFLTDAYAAAGSGFGYTFPGRTRNPATWFGAWLRLDYLWAGPGWQAEYCRVEPRRWRCQHRAVVARWVWPEAASRDVPLVKGTP